MNEIIKTDKIDHIGIVVPNIEKALKHYKDDVKTVNNGQECGISFENATDYLEKDKLEFYEEIWDK